MTPSDPVDGHRAGHQLATPGVTLDPVLEDEFDPGRERYHAVFDNRRAGAMQHAHEIRDLIDRNTFGPIRERSLARDALQRIPAGSGE